MSGSRAVAFFRNLNLGQARTHSPTRQQLISTFAAAQAPDAVSFQTNGTVLFEATEPGAVVEDVLRRLLPLCGYAELAMVRSGGFVHDVAQRLVDLPVTSELALFDGASGFPALLPWAAPSGRIEVVEAGAGHAIAVDAVQGTSFATPELERLLGVPVTSRGAGTVLRLARALRDLDG